jgi:hypothetical protein
MTTTSNESAAFGVRRLRSRVRDRLVTEYLQLRTVDRPALLRRLQIAMGSQDAEVFERQLVVIEERINAVHDHLGVIHERHAGQGAGSGCGLLVDLGEGPRELLLTDIAVDDDQVVTVDSPLGRALVGASPGGQVSYLTPEGPRMARLLAIEPEAGPEVVTQRQASMEVDGFEVQQTLLELDRPAAMALLSDVKYGRLAFCVHGAPHVEVVNFALVGGDPVFRIGASSKLSAALSGRQLALQADRIDERTRTGWAVTVAGPVHLVAREDGERLAAGLVPWAGGERPYVMKMIVRQVSGRRLLPSS